MSFPGPIELAVIALIMLVTLGIPVALLVAIVLIFKREG